MTNQHADTRDEFGCAALAIGAHPDDVELFCGGLVIRLGQLGHTVGVADMTRGEKASHGSVDERARETAAASVELGIAFRDNLELPDTELAATTAHVTAVVALLRRRRPEMVLAPWREDRHPDHVATSEIVTRAVMLAGVRKFAPEVGERFVPRQLAYYAGRHRMAPSFIVDTSAAAARKAKAIACYASQVGRRPGDDDPTLISEPSALAALDARDRYYGSMIGTTHGEALRMAAMPGIVDPIKQLRDNPFWSPHAFEALT